MPEKREPYNPLLKSYPDSEKVNSVSEGAETLFTRLIAQCDDANHYYGDAAMILGKLYTRRMCASTVDLANVQGRIKELVTANLIEIYEADGRPYLEIVNGRKDLRSDVKPDIRFPKRLNKSTARTRPVSESDSGTDSAHQPNPNEPNPTQPKTTVGCAHFPEGFARFWAAFPRHHRKQGKAKCLEHWKRQKLERIADQVVASLEHCARSSQWQRGYVPFPMTWLNRTPWETPAEDMPDAPELGDEQSPAEWAKQIAERK